MKILKNKKPLQIVIMVLLIILIGLETATFAKYVIEKINDYFVSSKDFYFTSNILKKDNPHYKVNNWTGVGEFFISVDLSSKKNTYIYTDYDIPYEVEVVCPNDVICNVDKPTGIIRSSSHTDTIVVSVAPTRLYTEGEEVDIEIKATSQSPYVKTISSVFEYIVGKLGTTYEINDEQNRTYLLLNVTNAVDYCTVITAFDTYSVGDKIDVSKYIKLSSANKDKCVSKKVSVTFNPNVIFLDTVSEILNKSTYSNTTINGTNYINGLEYYIGPASTIDVKFYKNNPSIKYTYDELLSNNIMSVQITDVE